MEMNSVAVPDNRGEEWYHAAMRRRRNPVLIAAVLLVLPAAAPSAGAQILNTLRGFDETERGWSGRVEAAVAVAGGARAVASLGFRGDIVGNLCVLLNYSLEYDSNPPPEVGRTDMPRGRGLISGCRGEEMHP
jgi:hypothetical protein